MKTALALTVSIILLLGCSNEPRQLPAPVAAYTAPPPAAPPPAAPLPTSVIISIEGAPGARIFFDDILVTVNPFKVKRADSNGILRVEKEGFEPFVASVMRNTDHNISVSLKPRSADSLSSVAPKTPQDLLAEPQYQYSQENAEEHCRGEWEKRGELNKGMYRYCLRGEKKGYKSLERLVKKHSDLQWIVSVLPRIWNEWTKRGITQYGMVRYSLNKEVDGYLDYQYEQKQSNFDTSKMNRCIAQWQAHGSPWSMAVYCYKE